MEAVELKIDAGPVVFRVFRFENAGAGSTPPLVLFHGFTGSAAVWQELAYEWAADRTVFALDLPGHGATQMPTALSWERHIEALANLIRSLAAGPVHLLGYSMGARLALGIAAAGDVPLQSLTLESVHPGLRSADERSERRASDQRWIELLQNQGIEAFTAAWEALPLWRTQETASTRARLHRSIRRNQRAAGLSASLAGAGLAEQPDLWDALPLLAPPVHVIAGGEDTKFSRLAGEISRQTPRCRTTLFPDCGHSVNIEAPVEYLAATQTFFEDSETQLPSFSLAGDQHVDR